MKEIIAISEASKCFVNFDIEKNFLNSLAVLSAILDIPKSAVYIVDKETREIEILTQYGIKKGEAYANTDTVKKAIKFGVSMIEEEENEIRFIIPIKFENKVLGAIVASRVRFDEKVDDFGVLKTISSIMGQYIKLWESYKELKREYDELKIEIKDKYSIENIIGTSSKMKDVFRLIYKVSSTKATVIIRGESGVGKELIAKAIHFMSERKNGPFIKVNCSAIPETLLEAELFGYEKGAFTGAVSTKKGKFELADGGTIFLDEIGDLPLSLQPKILRVIQEKEFERLGGEKTIKVDCRIISATNRNLEKLMEEGKFREDLYYRLHVFPIFVPPLRERKEDILPLTEFFIEKFSKEYNKKVKIKPETIKVFLDYDWPGNVRELENLIERLIILKENGEEIKIEDLPEYILKPKAKELGEKIIEEKIKLDVKEEDLSTVEEIEKKMIENALKKAGGIQKKAAKILGLTPRQIGYKIKKYGIKIEK